MTPEDWQRVKPILDSALRLDSTSRPGFLKQACKDLSLRREIESLIAAHEQAGTEALNSSPLLRTTLARGTRLGDFQIVSLLGAGGMGEVYRARDLRLERDVAIKVLPRFVSVDSERLRRFEQEAKAAAGLNHPNILAVFQMGSFEEAPYLVSELLEGETLREQVKRGPISAKKAVDYAVQIAQGLAAAHEKGIVHRDLKPENLFVTREGRIKILDFGLAKLIHSEGETLFTKQTLDTQPGAVLGTVGYMSPEQVRGLNADHRSDIFAFGAILYEMLTGRRAFHKSTTADTMSAILNEDPPPVSHTTQSVSPALDRAVQRCLEKSPEQRFQSASDLAFALEVSSDINNTSRAMPAATSRITWKRLAGAVATVALLSAATFLWHPWSSRALTEKDTIVLADFDNKTGDSVFDDALKQALAVQLEQSPFLNILSDRKVSDTLKLMGRSPGEHLSGEVAKEVCIRSGSKAVLQGSISKLGNEYVLGLNATTCVSGDTLTAAQAETSSKEGVLKALSTIVPGVRSRLGESLASVERFDVSIVATTHSLEALKVYRMGNKTLFARGTIEAIPFYKQAIELDPDFAKAYLALGKMYTNLDERNLASENLAKAYALRDRVSEREKYDISAEYFDRVTGDLDKAVQTYDAWIRLYPRDRVPVHNRANVYMLLGQYEKAVEGYSESRRDSPDFAYAYTNLASAFISLGRLQDAESALDGLKQNNLDPDLGWSRVYALAFLRNDSAEMDRQINTALRRPDSEDDALATQAATEAYHGRLARARELVRRAVDSNVRAGFREIAARRQAMIELTEAEFGKKVNAASALSLSRGQLIKALSALALAINGDAGQANLLVSELEKTYPFDTILNRYWLPTIKAALQLSRKSSAAAITSLEPALPLELGNVDVGPLYPAYVRGQAYLQAHNGPAAVAEFQKILDHPGIVVNDPIGALARLQLARAYTLQGDTPKAKGAYQDFITLWKDADPDIPILKEAKAEYARLQ